MDVEKFAQEAFRRDAKLRYVGIVDNQFHILLSKMREGVPSVTPAEDDRNFIQLMPPILVEAAEKLQRILGDLESVTMRYEKVLLVFFRVRNLVVILSYDPKVTTPFVSAVSDLIRLLGATYLGE
ncbi:MAG: hypothetical protein ABSF63_03045 [Candidatus Bathyarchaeia archaeon]